MGLNDSSDQPHASCGVRLPLVPSVSKSHKINTKEFHLRVVWSSPVLQDIPLNIETQ